MYGILSTCPPVFTSRVWEWCILLLVWSRGRKGRGVREEVWRQHSFSYGQSDRAVKYVVWTEVCAMKRTFPWSTRIMLFPWPSTNTVSASSGAHYAILIAVSRQSWLSGSRVVGFTITCFLLCVVYNVLAWVAKALRVNAVHVCVYVYFGVYVYFKHIQEISLMVCAGTFLRKIHKPGSAHWRFNALIAVCIILTTKRLNLNFMWYVRTYSSHYHCNQIFFNFQTLFILLQKTLPITCYCTSSWSCCRVDFLDNNLMMVSV